jgi:hypothetical protein
MFFSRLGRDSGFAEVENMRKVPVALHHNTSRTVVEWLIAEPGSTDQGEVCQASPL